MIVHHADWILPVVSPPIHDGWIVVDRHRIAAVGSANDIPPRSASEAPPPFGGAPFAILPGLINAHTHLELSWMKGLIPPSRSMPEWASALIAKRRALGTDDDTPIPDAIVELRRSGTHVIGEVTNTLASYGSLMCAPEVSACIFREIIGFNVADPAAVIAAAEAEIDSVLDMDWLRFSLVPHAPYSVHPRLLTAIADASRGRVVSVHLAESIAELEFLETGTGPWRDVLQRLGAWTDDWSPPRCRPVAYLEQCGLVNDRLLAVHAVHLTDDELRHLATRGAAVVTCPRSNRWTGAGDPPIERFYASGVRVAIGTDSLASVDDLNLFNELAAVRALAPDVPAGRIIESATRIGAEALDFGHEFGTIEPGKRAELIAVRIPPDVPDVEEYLLTGISPLDVAWLDTSEP